MTQLNNRAAAVAAGAVPVGSAAAAKNRFCIIATSGVTWHTVPAQLPIAVIRQPGNTQSFTLSTDQSLCKQRISRVFHQ